MAFACTPQRSDHCYWPGFVDALSTLVLSIVFRHVPGGSSSVAGSHHEPRRWSANAKLAQLNAAPRRPQAQSHDQLAPRAGWPRRRPNVTASRGR